MRKNNMIVILPALTLSLLLLLSCTSNKTTTRDLTAEKQYNRQMIEQQGISYVVSLDTKKVYTSNIKLPEFIEKNYINNILTVMDNSLGKSIYLTDSPSDIRLVVNFSFQYIDRKNVPGGWITIYLDKLALQIKGTNFNILNEQVTTQRARNIPYLAEEPHPELLKQGFDSILREIETNLKYEVMATINREAHDKGMITDFFEHLQREQEAAKSVLETSEQNDLGAIIEILKEILAGMSRLERGVEYIPKVIQQENTVTRNSLTDIIRKQRNSPDNTPQQNMLWNYLLYLQNPIIIEAVGFPSGSISSARISYKNREHRVTSIITGAKYDYSIQEHLVFKAAYKNNRIEIVGIKNNQIPMISEISSLLHGRVIYVFNK